MLIQLGVNDSLAKCHSVARKCPGSIVVWNGSCYEVIAETSSQVKHWAGLIASGCFFYGSSAWSAWKSGDPELSIICGTMSFTAAAVAASSLAFRQSASDCAAFLNGHLSAANNWREDMAFQEIARPQALLKSLIRAVTTIQIVYPWLFSLVALAWPCSPLNMFSSLIGWCDEGSGNSGSLAAKVATAIGTATLHVVFWKAAFSQGILGCVHMVLGSSCQNLLLKFLSNPHLPSDFPSQLKYYRSCQILTNFFSNYCATVGLAIIAILLLSQIMTSYLLLKILGGLSNLPLLMKILLISGCPMAYLFQVIAVGQAAHVHTASLSILSRAMQGNTTAGSKLARRQLRSAPPLKIKLGECNFVEASTTLVMLDFTPRRLVDLLLIGG